jgi:dCTP deaminase
MLLVDSELRRLLVSGELKITPIRPNGINNAYVMLSLGTKFGTFLSSPGPYIDPGLGLGEELVSKHKFTPISIDENSQFIIAPGEYVLGFTKEVIALPKTHAGFLFARASLSRLGLQVFCSDGFVDPGFSGNISLEIFNAAKFPIILRANMPIIKLALVKLQGKLDVLRQTTLQIKDTNVPVITRTEIPQEAV